MDALKVVLPSECTDNTIPTERELIFKVLKKGDGSGLAYIGFFQVDTAPIGSFPSVEIIQGEGKLYLDRAMTMAVDKVDTDPTNRHNYFYLKVNSESLHLRFNNADYIYGLHTQVGAENTRNFFSRLSENSPEADCFLSDFENATRLARFELHNFGASASFPQYIHGDLSDLSSLKQLRVINFDGQKYITGNPASLYMMSVTKNMSELTLSRTSVKGIIENRSESGFGLISTVYGQSVDLYFDTSFFKNREFSVSPATAWVIDNLKGDLADIPKVYSLYFAISQNIDGLIYSRSKVLELDVCRRFYITPKMNLQMYENIIADLANESKVTFIAGAVLGLFVVDADIANVSVTTKGYITALRNKGLVFTTNITV